MRTLRRCLIATCCVTSLAGAQRPAANPRDALLVTPQWLNAHLHDPNIVILHMGDPSKYASSHIPGARLIEMDDLAVTDMAKMIREMKARGMTPPDRKVKLEGPENGMTLEMPTAEQLRSQLAKFGIGDNSTIVVYHANQWYSPSTRIMLTLDYAGLGGRTVMLDGGLSAWIHANYAVTTEVPPPATPGKLSALTLRPIIATAQFVHERAGTPGIALIDARAASFYQGVPAGNAGPGDRFGHIPHAKSLSFDQVFDDAGYVEPADTLRALFARAGVQPGDTVVAYCHIGQQATAVLFAARTLGYAVKLYDGSFDEWNKLTQYPVENPSAKP